MIPTEMYALIGILIAVGQNHGNRVPLDEVRTSNKLFAQFIFTAATSRDRYKCNSQYIRFYDTKQRKIV
jgi:hypothetical protein